MQKATKTFGKYIQIVGSQMRSVEITDKMHHHHLLQDFHEKACEGAGFHLGGTGKGGLHPHIRHPLEYNY